MNETYLVLQCKDCGDATINRVGEACLSLIADSEDSIVAAVGRDVHEKFGDVAGAKHLVDGSKASSPLIGAKMGSEDAGGMHAFSPKEFACTARRMYSNSGRRRRFRLRPRPLTCILTPVGGRGVIVRVGVHVNWVLRVYIYIYSGFDRLKRNLSSTYVIWGKRVYMEIN